MTFAVRHSSQATRTLQTRKLLHVHRGASVIPHLDTVLQRRLTVASSFEVIAIKRVSFVDNRRNLILIANKRSMHTVMSQMG